MTKIIALKSPNKKRVPGNLKGKVHILPNFFARMTKEELAEWDIE